MLDWLRTHWVGALVIAAVAISYWASHQENQKNDRASIRRQVEACRRANPSRAYLQLRAREFVQGDEAPSYTTTIAPIIYAVLDCKDSVETGRPVALYPSLQEEYLQLFSAGYVPITRGQSIVGKIRISEYYSVAGLP